MSKGRFAILYRIMANDIPRYARTYIGAFVMMGLVSAATTATAWLMKDIINKVFVARDSSLLWVIALAVLVIFTIKGLAGYGQELLLGRAGNRIVADYQRKIFEHALLQDMRFFDIWTSSKLTNRMTQAVLGVRTAINLVAVSLGRDLMTLIGLVGMMVVLDPILCVVALVIGPLALFGVMFLGRQIRALARQEMGANVVLITGIRECVQGAQVIKTFNLEKRRRLEMDEAVRGLEERANKRITLTSAANPLMEVLAGFAIAGVIAYSGSQVISGARDAGSFFSFITALLLAYEPAKRVARLQVQLESSLAGVEMMFNMLDQPCPEQNMDEGRDVTFKTGHVVFDRVSFAYNPKKPVAKEVSLDIAGGKVTALIGPSGSGKTTLTRLIPRLYDVTDGKITIDGVDTKDISLACLRRQIAIVSQDVFLFEGTVYDNIALGREGASEEEVYAAAKAAMAHDFIMDLAQGYQTMVGEQGHNLSGGQRQRLSIARALLKDARIIILDEATSALDSHTEHQIRTALEQLVKGRTVVMIAHRLSTIVRADRIYVIEDGRTIDSGSHDELMEREGHYKTAFALQIVS